jgi:hypothetical protein
MYKKYRYVHWPEPWNRSRHYHDNNRTNKSSLFYGFNVSQRLPVIVATKNSKLLKPTGTPSAWANISVEPWHLADQQRYLALGTLACSPT